jgi:hypothetical protein
MVSLSAHVALNPAIHAGALAPLYSTKLRRKIFVTVQLFGFFRVKVEILHLENPAPFRHVVSVCLVWSVFTFHF